MAARAARRRACSAASGSPGDSAAATALRRNRLLGGTAIALLLTALVRDGLRGGRGGQRPRPARRAGRRVALRSDDRRRLSRRCATGRSSAGSSARLTMHLDATVDLRPIGTVELTGRRVGDDFRWLAYVATSRQLGQYGSARVGDRGLVSAPGTRLAAGRPGRASADGYGRPPGARDRADARATGRRPRTAASRSSRAPAPGAAGSRSTARRSPTRSRRSSWLVGDADLHRWRGQLDYWVFLDGELGQVAGSAQRRGVGIVPDALLGDHRRAADRDGARAATRSSILRTDDHRRRARPVRDEARPARPADPARRDPAGPPRGHPDRPTSRPGSGCPCGPSTAT